MKFCTVILLLMLTKFPYWCCSFFLCYYSTS